MDLLVETGLARLGVGPHHDRSGWRVRNNRREDEPGYTVGPADLIAGRYLVLRRGKKDYHLVKFD